MTHMAIAEMAQIAILAIMATIVMANDTFSMAIRSLQLKSLNKTSSVMLNSYESDFLFRCYQHFCDYVIFTQFLQCKNGDFAKIGTSYNQNLLIIVVQGCSKNYNLPEDFDF